MATQKEVEKYSFVVKGHPKYVAEEIVKHYDPEKPPMVINEIKEDTMGPVAKVFGLEKKDISEGYTLNSLSYNPGITNLVAVFLGLQEGLKAVIVGSKDKTTSRIVPVSENIDEGLISRKNMAKMNLELVVSD